MIEYDNELMHSRLGQQVSLTLLSVPKHGLIAVFPALSFAFPHSDHDLSGQLQE
jgi:hypothetical protein